MFLSATKEDLTAQPLDKILSLNKTISSKKKIDQLKCLTDRDAVLNEIMKEVKL